MFSPLPRRREPGGGAAAVQDALEIGKDFGVIENEGGQGFHRIEGDLRGVVPGAELFGIQGFGDKHGGDGVLAGIAEYTPSNPVSLTRRLVSSKASRTAACSADSPRSMKPPGKALP